MRGIAGGRMTVAAVLITPAGATAPEIETDRGGTSGRAIMERGGLCVWRYALDLPARADAWYRVGDAVYEVNAGFDGDMRIAFVSCNGQEANDSDRSLDERNALWRRLATQHGERPFQLLLHGGDQIYADELLDAHPAIRQWADGELPAEAEAGAEVEESLRDAFFARYVELLSQPEIGWMMARVPSLAMWDDHDICDGWGSLPPAKLDSAVGQALFRTAREHFLTFQLGAGPDEVPDICPYKTGGSLTWHVALPGAHVVAPDLRSERRPDRVMGENGWRALDAVLGRIEEGRVLLLSSVPALGPRLSWVEALMHVTPRMEKYEDDLRDQWQSRWHREEWRVFLERLAKLHAQDETRVTVVSGEIHLATRGTLDVPPEPLHQLVASGIAHPAPPVAYARTLGALARFGGSPLPGHRIRLHPLPGRAAVYTAQRNYLVLERRGGEWSARWELEDSGTTPALML
jgi:hypothetical protein